MKSIKIPLWGLGRYAARGIVVIIIAWLLIKTSTRIADKKQVETNLQTLPVASVLGLDSAQFSIAKWTDNQAIIIFYFDPNCEHCQSEAQALKKQAEAFKEAKLLWVSVARLAELRVFEQKYQLQKTFGNNLQIAQITPEVADKQFGFRVVPTILIYDIHQKLVKKYVGETKIETILKHLL